MIRIDIKEIIKRLPHRYPFLLVDRIIDFEEGKRVVGLKNVTFNEPFFQGHFPENPIMPGVLILEAMAQTGGALLLGSVSDKEKKLIYLIGVDKARFRKPVLPGDQLRMEVSVTRIRGNFCQLWAEAFVDNEKVAEAEFLSTMVEKE